MDILSYNIIEQYSNFRAFSERMPKFETEVSFKFNGNINIECKYDHQATNWLLYL